MSIGRKAAMSFTGDIAVVESVRCCFKERESDLRSSNVQPPLIGPISFIRPLERKTRDEPDRTRAEPIRRTPEIEEITYLYFIHPLAVRLVPFFARMRITPNVVSITGMLFGILAAFAYYRYADLRFAITGFALMIAWHVMDGADGQLARFTHSYSCFGKVLDGIADNVTFLAVYTALAIALSRTDGQTL